MIFDRSLVRLRRARAALGFSAHAFLFERAAADLIERLGLLERPVSTAIDLAARGGVFRRALSDVGQSLRLIEADLVPDGVSVVVDEEALPFATGAADLIVSLLSLHAVNDVPGALIQIRRALKPDGLFLGAMFGAETLRELRHCLADAEIECEGGLSPRVAPFADIRDAAGLLQRAGFERPVVDRDEVSVTYPTPLHLMRDLRGMGETNALTLRRRTPLRRATLLRACALYDERYGTEDGRVQATFDILYLTGFAGGY